MIIPVRCFTCGNVLADKYLLYLDLVAEGVAEETALDAFNLQRFCCRRMFLTHVDFSDLLLKFNPADTNVMVNAPGLR
ncbi:DNA-directed RNA polymerase subunit [Trypanosoma rangeli SC58]|uniref:DNA-directed RNA polymerases I, II, and III subunit RPABC5 n=1 Tax=Trypanosoma rangeli SC58 TaxID=429131 RepID=A0A061IX46_TRYRA|nr:DNA-directed RNA polymerase subunit [Trypanosoma rangeli SC58]